MSRDRQVKAADLLPRPGGPQGGGALEVDGLARGGRGGDGGGPGLALRLGPQLAGPPRGHRRARESPRRPQALGERKGGAREEGAGYEPTTL